MDESDALARVPLFASLSSTDLALLSAALRSRRYAKGEVIFHRDDPASSLYLVKRGSIRISVTSPDGKELILALLGESDYFGELALLDGQPRSADAVATESCELLSLQREAFWGFLKASPDGASRMLAALSRQLRKTTDQLQDAAFLDVPTRLLRQLLALSRSSPQDGNRSIRLTQAQIGALVGASRESVNKWLSNYERRGLVRRTKSGLEVLKHSEIERLIEAAAGQ